MKHLILAYSLLSASSQASSFAIDFRNGIWDHSAVGGSSASTGWATNPSSVPANSKGYSSGTTEVGTGVFLTVTSQFLGSAQAGANNLTFAAVNTPGFAFQNSGTEDKNTGLSGGNTILLNYQRIDFSFTEKVTLDSLQIGDIDTSSGSGAQAWRDTVGLELWNGSVPASAGSGIAATVETPGATRLLKATTSGGLNYAYANTLGNTSTSNNPMSPTNPSSAIFSYDAAPVDGFSIYLWNRGTGTGGKHAVVLQASSSSLTVVPEPSSALLCLTGIFSLVIRRKRN